MSWSYKIIIVYVVFITGILGMVYVASKQTNEMQEENYYAKELKYQDVIDGKNNLNNIDRKVSIANNTDNILIAIPVETSINISDGKIYFLRPSDQTKDLHIALNVDKNGKQAIPLSSFIKGLYSVQISWKSNGKTYYSEENFNVQK